MSERDTVAGLYDSAPEREWARLDERRIEFGVTRRALEEFLPPAPAEILDIGSGPGRYAIPLVAAGYSVSLLDLSAECLKLAEREATLAGVSFGAVELGDATDLRTFEDASFDAGLLLGPLYHLKSEERRAEAVSEAQRVLRPGGVLFAAFLSRYSVVRYAAKTRPDQFTEDSNLIESILDQGHADSERADATFLNGCYFAEPAEVQPFMERCGLETLSVLGCEGVVSEVEERLNDLPEADFSKWVDLNYRLGRRKELLAASAHVLHIGRRP